MLVELASITYPACISGGIESWDGEANAQNNRPNRFPDIFPASWALEGATYTAARWIPGCTSLWTGRR